MADPELIFGFHTTITPCHLKCADDAGREVICRGYWFELVEDNMDEAEQLAMDVVDGSERGIGRF